MILAELNPNKNRVKTELEPCEDWYDVPSDEMTLGQARQAVKDLRKKLAEYLGQQTCEEAKEEMGNTLDNNLINRQAVHDLIAELLSDYLHDEDREKIEELDVKIEDLPSVTPKEKIGKWIDDEFGSKCSCCGIHTHLDKFDRPMKFEYCSMCGAKMIKSQESEG